MATIKDIAKLAGVSTGTVSNVLNNKKGVSLEKIRAVKDAADKLGYLYNFDAGNLKKGSSKYISICIPSLQNNKYRDLYSTLQQDLTDLEYEVSLYLSDDIQANEIKYINKLKSKPPVCQIVLTCLNNIDYYQNLNIATFFVNRIDPDILENKNHYYIGFDFKTAGLEVAEYIEKNNYKKIAFFTSSRRYYDNRVFIDQIKNNINDKVKIKVFSSDNKFSLKKSFEILAKEDIDLIITSDNERAESIYTASQYLSLSNIKILSLDSFKTFNNSKYTTYEMNYKLMGHRIVNMILNLINSKEEIKKVTILDNEAFRNDFKINIINKAKKLRLLTLISPMSDVIKYMKNEFTEATGIELQVTALPYEELHNQAKLFNKDYYYDLVRIDVAHLRSLGENIYTEIKEDSDVKEILKFLQNDNLDTYTRIKNRLYCLPFDPSVQILLYRKDLFEDTMIKRLYYEKNKKGLDVPTNFEQYNEIAKFFTKKINPDSPVSYGTTTTMGSPMVAASDYLPRLYQYSNGILQQRNGKLDHSALKKSIANYLESYEYSDKHNNDWWSVSAENFAKGSCAMTIIYSNHAYKIADSKISKVVGKVGGAIVPGNYPLLGGGVIGISKYSKNYESCINFFKRLYNDQISSALCLMAGTSPNLTMLYNYDILSIYPWLKEVWTSFSIGNRRLIQDSEKKLTLIDFENIVGSAIKNTVNKYIEIDEAIKFIETVYASK